MHEALTLFAHTWGMYYTIAIFAGVLVYALWPKNQATFDHAARMPLETDDDHVE